MPYEIDGEYIEEFVTRAVEENDIKNGLYQAGISKDFLIQLLGESERTSSILEAVTDDIHELNTLEKIQKDLYQDINHIKENAPTAIKVIDSGLLSLFIPLIISGLFINYTRFGLETIPNINIIIKIILSIILFVTLIYLLKTYPSYKTNIDYLNAQININDKWIRKVHERIEREIYYKGVSPEIRSIINSQIDNYNLTLVDVIPTGLSGIHEQSFEVPTRAKKELVDLIENLPGGSIGISGVRGSGKTTLLHSLLKPLDRIIKGRLAMPILTSAPVKYDARDFILHLFSLLCSQILEIENNYDKSSKKIFNFISINFNEYSNKALKFGLLAFSIIFILIGSTLEFIYISLFFIIDKPYREIFLSFSENRPEIFIIFGFCFFLLALLLYIFTINEKILFSNLLTRLEKSESEIAVQFLKYIDQFILIFSLYMASILFYTGMYQLVHNYGKLNSTNITLFKLNAEMLSLITLNKFEVLGVDPGSFLTGGCMMTLFGFVLFKISFDTKTKSFNKNYISNLKFDGLVLTKMILLMLIGFEINYFYPILRDSSLYNYLILISSIALVLSILISIYAIFYLESTMANQDRNLQDEAFYWLGKIRFQRSYSSGWSGSLKLPIGMDGGINAATTMSENILSLPELVKAFLNVLEIASKKYLILIGIDELDKIESDEEACLFLNEIKMIFNLENVFYILSVSENAMSNFEMRGLPFRSTFESAFDEIISVECLDLEETKQFIRRRVIGMSVPFICLCYCMSGGLARDLIRSCRRTLYLNRGNTISELSRILIKDDLKSKIKAASTTISSYPQNSQNRNQYLTLYKLNDLLDAPDYLQKCWNWIQNNRGSNLTRSKRSTEKIENHDALLFAELRVYIFYCLTLIQVFDNMVEVSTIKDAEKSGLFDHLANVKRELSLNPSAAETMIFNLRDLFKIAPPQRG